MPTGNVVDNDLYVINHSDVFTFDGVISGSGAVSSIGIGTVIFTAANTYAGTTTISAGTLQIGNGSSTGSLGSGAVVDNSLLVFDHTDLITVSNSISGSGSFLQNGTGYTYLTGDNTYIGGTTVAWGTLSIGNVVIGSGATGSIVGNVSVASGASLWFGRAGDTSFDGSVSGSGTIAKMGAGTLTLTGNNSFQGFTDIFDGTLQIGNGGTTGSLAGRVAFNSSHAVLSFDRSDTYVFDGGIFGPGAVSQIGTGTTVLTAFSGYNNLTILISAGKLQLGNGGVSGLIAGNVTNNSILAFDHSDTVAFSGVISGSGTVNQVGSGTTTLSAANTYTGGSLISAGTLDLAVLGAAGTNTITFGTGNETLRIQDSALLSRSFGNTIDKFGFGNIIDLPGLVFGPGATAVYSAATQQLAVSSGGITDTLKLTNLGASNFIVAGDGIGGTEVKFLPSATFTGETLNGAHVTLSGTADPGDTISVSDGAQLIGTTVASSSGTWSLTTGSVSNVIHTYTAKAADIGGNIGPISNEAILGGTVGGNLTGTGNDIIIGGAGNDIIVPGGGHNTIDGGGGFDTVVVHAPIGTASWVVTNGSVALQSAESTDQIINVERVQFSDGVLALDIQGNAGNAYRLYQAAFDRTPDGAGLSFWSHALDQGLNIQTVAQDFVNSSEFKSVYGASPTNAQIVSLFYENVLGRAGETAGINFWVGQLNAGTSVGAVLEGFAVSSENHGIVDPKITQGILLDHSAFLV